MSARPRTTFNQATPYANHDQRETVPILVRPRDDDDDGDDDDDADDADYSGAVSDRSERLSLTLSMMDRRRGTTATALHSFKQHGY